MRILILRQAYQTLLALSHKHQAKFDFLQHFMVWAVALCILLFSLHFAKQPINAEQQQEVVDFSQYYLYPNAQLHARALLEQPEHINRYQYFHFLRMVQDEEQRLNVQEQVRWETKLNQNQKLIAQ